MNPVGSLAFAVSIVLQSAAAGQTPPKIVDHGAAPVVSPDGTRIAFLSDRDGATDVYVIGADGTGEIRLTRSPETESQPAWSADGKQIWFTVFANDSSAIYSIGANGGDSKRIGTVPGRAMRLSPDGTRVLYWIGTWTSMKLFSSALDGSNALQLTDGSGVVWGARWSPDGKRIAFADRDSSHLLKVHVMNADGTGRTQIPFVASAFEAQMPAWSPDAKLLAVQGGGKGKPAHIWVVDAATGSARNIAPHESYDDEVPTWFPDGKRLAFQSNRTGAMEIWVMSSDGSNQRQVTH